MKKIALLLAILILFFNSFSKAQIYCDTVRYYKETFAVAAPTTITYGSNLDVNGSPFTLTMDVYEPTGDTCMHRPVIFFTHGGSFIGGTKNDGDVVTLCQRFAKRGYVTVSINYRLGMGSPINQAGASAAVYRATQDMKAAIRWMRKDASLTNQFKIEPNYIFGGGSSAGAFCALHNAYLDDPAEIGTTIDTTKIGCGGGLEGLSGNLGFSSSEKAVINLCGALGKKEWMHPGDEPLCGMHGTIDNVVPYGTATIYIFSVIPIMVVDGSHTLDSFATAQGGPYSIFHSWAGLGHVPYTSDVNVMDFTVGFVRDFLRFQLGCGPDPKTIYYATGIANTNIVNAGINAYPNPSDEEITIALQGYEFLMKEIILTDVSGRKLKTFYPDVNQFSIHKNELSSGLYFLQIKMNDGSVVSKRIVFE